MTSGAKYSAIPERIVCRKYVRALVVVIKMSGSKYGFAALASAFAAREGFELGALTKFMPHLIFSAALAFAFSDRQTSHSMSAARDRDL